MPDRLHALDAAFLNLERPHAPMHVAGLYIFKGKPERPDRPGVYGLFRSIQERLHLVPRYRQRVLMVPFGLGHPVWVDDPNFDLSYHLRRAALPKPGGQKELLDFVARVHARPLDRNHPLWEVYVIEGLEDGNIAVYAKTHHCMVDGLSVVDIATVLLDLDVDGWVPAGRDDFAPEPLPSRGELVSRVLGEAAQALAGTAATTITKPTQLPGIVGSRLARLARVPPMLKLLVPAPESPLNEMVGPSRRIEVFDLTLNKAKLIKNVLGGTVNDVVLTAVGEGLHVFLEERGVDTEGLVHRVMVPVSVRDESERLALGNRLTGMFLDLPVGRMPARERLRTISERTLEAKQKREPVAAENLMGISAWAPAALHSVVGRLGSAGTQRFFNLVVSNVPALQVPVYAGGARLLRAYPLLPLGMNLAVVVCVTSYNGGMYFGIVGDYDALPDLDVLASGIRAGFERLVRSASVIKAASSNGNAKPKARGAPVVVTEPEPVPVLGS